MNILSGTSRHVPTVAGYRLRRTIDELVMLGGATFGALVIAVLAGRSPYTQFSFAATLYMIGVAVILTKPRMGVYFLVFFSLVGEPNTMFWYPFNKNGSSAESFLYVDDRLVASPFEGYVMFTLIGLLLHRFRSGQPITVATPFTWPAVLFSGAVTLALMWGAATGGTLSIGVNQTRSIIILPLLYLLFVNLLDRKAAFTVLWVAVWAIVIESCFALWFTFVTLDDLTRQALLDAGNSPITHSVAVQLNLVLFLLGAVILFRNSSLALRIALPFLSIPVGFLYLVAERRAAVGALLMAVVLLFAVLARRQPGRFWLIGPVLALLLTGYCLAFWNSQSSAGFPAQAIKSQIVDDSSGADSSSDLYREIENWNLSFMIRSSPLQGSGFGKPFTIVIPLADISGAFPLWRYFPHNSMLGLWAFGGVLAIASWLYLAYVGVREGFRTTVAATNPRDTLTAMTGSALVLMIVIYSYLDISFDNQTMLLFAAGLALITTVSRGQDDDAEAETIDLDAEDQVSHSRRQRRNVGV